MPNVARAVRPLTRSLQLALRPHNLARSLGMSGEAPYVHTFVNDEAAAAVARMVTEPSGRHKEIIDLFFTRLKVGAVHGTNNLAGADRCVLPMFTGVGDQWINLLGAGNDPYIESGAPTFHPEYGGYECDGVDDHIGWNFDPSLGGVNFVRDSACWAVLHFKESLADGSTAGRFNTNGATLAFGTVAGNTQHRINQNAADSVGSQTSAYGLLLSNRSASGAIQMDREGTQLDTGTNASTAIVAGDFLLGGIHATSFGHGHFGGYWASSSRTANQRADFAAAVREYYQAFLTLGFFYPVSAPSPRTDLAAVPKAESYSIAGSRSAWGATLTGDAKWVSNVLGADGRVYHPPFNASNILIVDTVTREAFRKTLGGTIGSGERKWHSGALSRHNGCIYCIPWDATSVLKINTKTRVATNLFGSDPVFEDTYKWGTGCEDPRTGLIVGAPNTRGTILRIDPTTDTYVEDDMGAGLSDEFTTQEQYAGVYPVADGSLVFVPYYATNILSADMVAGTARTDEYSASDGSSLSGNSKWAGGVYDARTNKIFGSPHVADDFLVIDCTAKTWKRSTLGLDFSGEPSFAWASGFLGPDGYIYMLPHDSTSGIIKIDPVAETAEIITLGVSWTGTAKWDGVCLTPNGIAVGAPSNGTDIALIEGFTPNFARSTLSGGWANNF